MKLSIIIPAYNEAERITNTIRSYHSHLVSTKFAFEIIVVDDGSTDDTVQIVKELSCQLNGLSILSLPDNRGKGAAVRHGMLAAKGNIHLFTDADGSTPATEMEKLLAPILSGNANIAIGSRYIEGAQVVKAQPGLRVKWSRAVNKLVQHMLTPGIADTHCGFKAFTAEASRELFLQCTIDGWSFDLEILSLARKHRYTITEVPVIWANDERSKGRLTHLPKEIYNFYKIKKRMAASQ